MSVLDALKGRPAKALPPSELLNDLARAEADLADLEVQHGGAALDALSHVQGAPQQLEDLNRQLAACRERATTLRAAHKAAIEREVAAIAAQRAALQKTQLAAARKHLEARDAAAVALNAAIVEVTKQYHTLLDRSAKARAACPVGMSWPPATFCEEDALRRLVTAELFRVSATPGNRDGKAFPGSQMPGVEFEYQPAAIQPLADQIKQASAYAVSKLKAPE